MTNRHKVFVSYHHAGDESYKKIFELRFGNRFGVLVSGSVAIGEIDPDSNTEYIRQRIRDEYLRDSSVTVVLVGVHTWQRKHVDWEIYSSLRDTPANPRSGLIGILLPSFQRTHGTAAGSWSRHKYVIPPRLVDNVESGFASLHDWSEDPDVVQDWIHKAYLRKGRLPPSNARPMFGRNRTAANWST